MDPLTIAASSGLRSRMESLSLLANNLANATTSGYKSDSEFYGLYTSPDGDSSSEGATLPDIQRQWTDFSQGTLQPTGNPFDVALSGPGFLTVAGPGGDLYTRNGNLHVSPAGDLVTSAGFAVRGVGGAAIHITSGASVEIAPDGVVRQAGHTLAQLAVVNFKSTNSLIKMGDTCFQNTDPKNPPVAAGDVQVQQGKLESSNVAVPEAAMRLVGMMRQFEMLQKAVSMGVEMDTKSIQEVARVGS
ncbi:MAG: flagellar hook basal-body protein [Bryobacteraceae bacterium]